MAIVGVGIDVVSIPDFAEQVDQPGTLFAETFTPGERRDAADKSSVAARHLAARWAAKEAVIKAWSGSRFAQRPVLPEGIHRDIEVVTDMWGRPKVRLSGDIAKQEAHLLDWGYPSVLEEWRFHVTLTRRLDDAARAAWQAAAEAALGAAAGVPRMVREVCVFTQAAPGAPFLVAERLPLGG